MNKESLNNRIMVIDKNINQLMANLNMLYGGKEECLYWLNEIDKSENLEKVE